MELQFHSQKQPDKADETRPIPVTERFKHFHDAFNALGRSYVSDPLARERASLQTRNVSRPRPNYRRAGKDAANKLQTENRQHVSKLNKVGQSQMKAQIKGVSHPDNNDMDETYEEYMSRKQRREREIFEAESARIQEENERLVLGDPYPTAKALASHNITVGPLDMMEEDLISFSPIKPKEPSRSRYLDLPIDEEKTRDLLNYKLPESESFATFAFSLRNAADHGNGNNSLAYSQRMASNNEFPNSQSKHSATSNQNIYDRDKHLSEEQLNALRGFSKQLHDVL